MTKHFYDAIYANDEYISTLSEARSGVMIYQEEIDTLNVEILTPYLWTKSIFIKQWLNNKNKIMFCDKSIYKYTDLGINDIKYYSF